MVVSGKVTERRGVVVKYRAFASIKLLKWVILEAGGSVSYFLEPLEHALPHKLKVCWGVKESQPGLIRGTCFLSR